MAFGKIYVFAFFTALVAVNLIFAEESQLEPNFFDQAEAGDDAERVERSANDNEDEEGQDRFFFSLFPVLSSCNYTAQGSTYCLSCRRAVRCLSNNVGIVRTCRGILPYCNQGRCSFIAGSACNSTG